MGCWAREEGVIFRLLDVFGLFWDYICCSYVPCCTEEIWAAGREKCPSPRFPSLGVPKTASLDKRIESTIIFLDKNSNTPSSTDTPESFLSLRAGRTTRPRKRAMLHGHGKGRGKGKGKGLLSVSAAMRLQYNNRDFDCPSRPRQPYPPIPSRRRG